jgi:hypothetical protein
MTTSQEGVYIRKSQELYRVAGEYAQVRKAIIEAYMTQHHPGIQCVATIAEDNVLSLEITFPGIEREQSHRLGNEIHAYLKSLLEPEHEK